MYALVVMAVVSLLAPADEPKPRVRNFVGTFQVAPESRDAVLKHLKSKGFNGAHVPDGVAPETILYRGPKAEYEAALEAFYRHVHPEWYGGAKADPAPQAQPAPKRAERNEYDDFGASPLQRELLDALKAEGKRKWEEMRKENPYENGLIYNRWWRGEWKAVLTRDQYLTWAGPGGVADVGPAPKLPALDPKAPKTDDVAFGRLGLSAKQKEHLDKHRKWKAEAEKKPDHDKAKTEKQWKDGLDRILTEGQLKAYRKYWDGK